MRVGIRGTEGGGQICDEENDEEEYSMDYEEVYDDEDDD
jgi:hypothetical protein